MSMKHLLSGFRGFAAAIFGALFFVIPVALLTSVRPWLVAIVFAGLGIAILLVSFSPLPRIRSIRTAGKGILAVAAILAVIHVSGALEPLYRRDGWLLLDLTTEVYPQQASPGETLTYKLSTTTTDIRPAMARRFIVDGVPYKGMLLYSFLPTHGGDGFALTGAPIANVVSTCSSPSEQETVYTVVYADLQLPVLNAANWDWSATYTEGWDVVGVITSNGQTHCDLGAGESLTLQYSVVVPPDHPEGKVRSARAGLSYRDPQWATHYIHELRFQFERTMIVAPSPT
jgi:hypothetical protein